MAKYWNISFRVDADPNHEHMIGVHHVYCQECFDRVHWQTLYDAGRATGYDLTRDACESCGHTSKDN